MLCSTTAVIHGICGVTGCRKRASIDGGFIVILHHRLRNILEGTSIDGKYAPIIVLDRIQAAAKISPVNG